MKKGRSYNSLYLPAVVIVGTVLTLLIVIAVSTYRNISRERGRTEEALLREAMVVIRAVEAGARADASFSSGDVTRLQAAVTEIAREPALAHILLFNRAGKVIAAAPPRARKERVRDAPSVELLLHEKGVISRYRLLSGGGEVFEVLKPFRPLAYRNPLAMGRGGEEGVFPHEVALQEWSRDKTIAVGLQLGPHEKARMEDIHHALLMGMILIVLGAGALYFIFIVQNYYRVDRSLAHMKTYTENVLESMADGLISVDSEARIVTLNRKAGEILGAAEEELKGKGIAQVLGGTVAGLLQSPEKRWMVREQEVEFVHRQGIRIPLSLSAAPLKDERGREMGSVLLLRDLREIRELQEKVRRSERLASLGRLAAGMAHEIRNPLSSIRGFAQYFMRRLRGQEEEVGYASIMVREVDRLNRVITQLLDFARPKEPQREPHSLDTIMSSSLSLLGPEIARRKVEVEKECEPALPLVAVDRDQLSQAFLNLLLNALESMDGGGKIRIGLRKGPVPSTVEATVADTGGGIPAEDLGKIFEPFFSTKRKGTGLGLAIVHQIVEGHGGEISVESREGIGTTFKILLPVNGSKILSAAKEQG